MKIEFDLSQVPKEPKLFTNFDMTAMVEYGRMQRRRVELSYTVRTQHDVYQSCLNCIFHNICSSQTRNFQRINCITNDELPECMSEYRSDKNNVIFIPVNITSKEI